MRHARSQSRARAHADAPNSTLDSRAPQLEVTELRLPTQPECAPRLALHQYCGPELSEWHVSWEPASTQAGGSIALRGRRFGVSFTIVVAVGSLRLSGLLVCRYTPEAERPMLVVGFKKAPAVQFDVSIAGKALSLGSETLRSWLHRQLDKALRDHLVLPKTLEIPLPFLRGAAGGSPSTGVSPLTAVPSSAEPLRSAGGQPTPAPTSCTPVQPASFPSLEDVVIGDTRMGDFPFGRARTPSPSMSSPPAAEGAGEEDDAEDAVLRALLALRVDSDEGPAWNLDQQLADMLGVPLRKLEERRPPLETALGALAEPNDWATALVIALLQLRHHDRLPAWSALVEVRRHSFARELQEAAMECICELVAAHT